MASRGSVVAGVFAMGQCDAVVAVAVEPLAQSGHAHGATSVAQGGPPVGGSGVIGRIGRAQGRHQARASTLSTTVVPHFGHRMITGVEVVTRAPHGGSMNSGDLLFSNGWRLERRRAPASIW